MRLQGILFISILLLGIALRVVYLITPHLDSDQAILGLMARHILDGEFPIFYWGENYAGPIESYFASIIFYLFGSSRLTLAIPALIFYLIFLFLIYRLAMEIFNEKVALMAMLLASASPPFLIEYSTMVYGNYIQNLVFGTLLLLMTYRFVKRVNNEKAILRYYIVIGFIAGLAWWLNFQIIHFLLTTFIFMFLKDRWRFIKRGLLYLFPSFMIGSSLFWYYNITNSWASIYDIQRYSERLWLSDSIATFFYKLSWVLGPFARQDIWYLNKYFLFLYGIALLYVLITYRKGLIDLFKLSLKKTGGAEILLVFLVIFSAIIISRYNTGTTIRYYLPLYSAFPIILAAFIVNTGKILRPLPLLLITLFVSFNIYGDIRGATIFDPKGFKEYKAGREWERKLFNFLETKGLLYVSYVDYWVNYKFTFDASERVIFTFPTEDWRFNKYPKYTMALNSFVNHAYMWKGGGGKNFEMILKSQGIDYRFENFYNYFYVFHSLKMPERDGGCIPASNLDVSSNYDEIDPKNAIDRDVTSKWHPKMSKGERVYFEIDMKRPYLIDKVSILNGGSFDNNPAGYELEVSLDKKKWSRVISLSSLLGGFVEKEGIPVLEGGYLISVFDPVRARYIRIRQGEGQPSMNWHIAEIFIYGPSEPVIDDEKNPSYLRGLKYYKEKKWEDALIEFLKVIESNPDSESSHYHLWLIAKDLGKNLYDDPYHLDPTSSVMFNLLVRIYEKRGDTKNVDIFREKIGERFTPLEKRSINFDGKIEFIGYDIRHGSAPEITYYWKAIGNIKKDWVAFVHFIRPDGSIAFQGDHPLFSGGRHSSRWIKGEFYKERLKIVLPQDIKSGTYPIKIGLWDPKTGKRLKVREGVFKKRDEIIIGELRITDSGLSPSR